MSAQQSSTAADVRLPDGPLRRLRPRLRVRLRSLWNRAELDQALAAGVDPLASEDLLWRAEQLVETQQRVELAETIDRIVKEVDRGGPQLLGGPVLMRRDVIRDNRSLLRVLAERLRSDGPQGLRGLAKVELLVRYGDSAIYRGPSALTLRLELLEALAALDPNDGWDRVGS
jgi:hypothetical protein